jgi:hypothetical protein
MASRSQSTIAIRRNSITTANIKRRLLEICGSEENLLQLKGLTYDFVFGEGEYSGALNQSQLLSFLEMALERKTTGCSKRPGRGCFLNEGTGAVVDGVAGINQKIEELGGDSKTCDYVRLKNASNWHVDYRESLNLFPSRRGH